jgi:aldose 1-epimerase
MSIETSVFGTLPDGTQVECCTLKNSGGVTAELLTYGCRIAKLIVPDRSGKFENIVLGHDTLEEYATGNDVFGAMIGRYANRIGGAKFRIGEKTWSVVKNEGENSLHSAPGGYQDRVWHIKRCDSGDDAPSVTFAYHSPAGECGFPGNVDVEVTYTLSTDNALIIEYSAKTDAETPFNVTNHSFFNLTGNPAKDVLSHELQLEAEYITEADDGLIPTGRLLPVEGTPFDFRKPKTIGQDIRGQDHLLKQCGGYDHNFAMGASDGVRRIGQLYDEANGRRMLVFTDLPGVQVYTANSFAPGMKGNGGVVLKPHRAVCLETQFYPDSVNRPEFPYENLKPGKPFHSTTIYKFVVD